jgi:RND family efflux transporter MFP subunit
MGRMEVNLTAIKTETKVDCPVSVFPKLANIWAAMNLTKLRMTTRKGLAPLFKGLLQVAVVIFPVSDALSQTDSIHRIELVKVQERQIATVLNSFGSLEPFRNIEISAKGQGQIILMPAREGGWVKEGEMLFEMDRRADEIALKRAEAELRKSELELDRLKAGSRPGEIEESTRRLAASDAVMSAAEDEWKRVQKLAEQGIAAASELVRSRSEFDVSVAQHSQAKARLELIQEGTRSEDVLISEAEVTIRKVIVEDIRRRMDELTVTAPFGGVIARQLKEVGEWATPGDMAIEMMVMDPMKLRISVPQKHVSQIAAGQFADVSIPGLDVPELRGKVLAVIPQASVGSRNFPVILELQNPDRQLASGMYAKVSLVLDSGQDVKVIPRTALQYRDQKLVVFRFHQSAEPLMGTVEEVLVEIGQELEGEVVVRSVNEPFLEQADPIVVMGGTKLKDGDQVRVLPPIEVSNPLPEL